MADPAHEPRAACQGLEPLVDEIRRRIEDNERFLKGLLLEEDPGEEDEGDEQPKEGEAEEDFEEL